MKKLTVIFLINCFCTCLFAQQFDNGNSSLTEEVEKLKTAVNKLLSNEEQSERLKFQKNHQLILYATEMIKEIHQGTMEISGSRSQNILYKKLIDLNNPASDVLGFQLSEVISKALENNLGLIPVMEHEKRRLKGQVSNLLEGVTRTFPPMQILTSTVSMLTSFASFRPRYERIGRKTDSLIMEVTHPVSKEILIKFSTQLYPYMDFYQELDRANMNFENALYQHEVQYRDFIEEVNAVKDAIEKKINLNGSIGEQINGIFDITNSSSQDFNFRAKNENNEIKELASQCMNVFDLVDRFKKFSNDFITIQDDFYRFNIRIMEQKARALPMKDDAKINQLIAELNQIKKGNPEQNIAGMGESYKLRLKSIASKLVALNKTRL